MKALLATLITFSSLASGVCGSSIYPLVEESDFKTVHESRAVMSKDEFNKVPQLESFDYEECKTAIKRVDLFNPMTKEFVSLFYTNEDECDGGNSYGGIMNANGEFFADITDSDISCE